MPAALLQRQLRHVRAAHRDVTAQRAPSNRRAPVRQLPTGWGRTHARASPCQLTSSAALACCPPQAWLYSWACLPQGEYIKRLGLLFGFFATTIGGPISYVTFDPAKDVSGGCFGSVGRTVVPCWLQYSVQCSSHLSPLTQQRT